jgi:5'-3' exonuclease
MEKPSKVLVLIDADSLVYASSKETLEESLLILDEKIANIFEKTGADFYSMFISLGSYFRHTLAPEYKASRKKYPSQLLWTRTLKNYLIEKYGAIAAKNVEADDLCAYFVKKKFYYNQMDSVDVIVGEKQLYFDAEVRLVVASPDKDLLQSIPGKHFNYSYKLEERDNPDSLIKGWWVETNQEDADNFVKMQTVIGDPGDSIYGLSGRGPAYWKKISQDGAPSWGELLEEYIQHHKNVSLAVFEFQKNYRLLKLLEEDSDFYREVGYLPEFKYYNVNKPVPVLVEENEVF